MRRIKQRIENEVKRIVNNNKTKNLIMKAEIIQNVMTFETDGINLLAVMMDNYELEMLEGVLEIAVEETTGKNKDSLQKILEEISTFRINKKALEERSSDRIRNLEFFLLPKGPGEVRFQSQKEGDPEQVFMFNREEITSIATALEEAIEALAEDKIERKIVAALYYTFSQALKDY